MEDKLRKTGIPSLGEVPWGSHICMFYPELSDALNLLVPYLKAGLEDHEFCFWVVPGKEVLEVCRRALGQEVKNLDRMARAGQIEIVCPGDWYTKDGKFDARTVLDGWILKLNRASKMGFEGIRIAADTSWLKGTLWKDFMDYELRVGYLLDKSKGIAICCYRLDCCDAMGVIDVVSNHQLTMIKQGSEWNLIENAERRKAQEAVQEMEEKYRRTVENIPLVIYSALPDEKSTTVMLTDRIKDITGYSAGELIQRPELYTQLIHPDDRDTVWKAIEEHRKNRVPLKLEYRMISKDGKIRWMKDEALPVLDEKGELVRIDGFMEDITDLKIAEEALRRSEERYELAQRGAKIGSWDWNMISGTLEWSEEIEPMFGFEKGKFERTYDAFIKSVHPEDRKFVQDSVAACVEKGDRYDIEHRIVWPDGSVHWLSEAGDVIRDPTGKAVRMLGIVRDVTSKKQSEERIKQLNRELEASNKELQAFCYSVSHDLRAPLRRIDGFSQLLIDDSYDKLDDRSKTYLSRIKASTRNMDQLIDDLLRLSRITTAEVSKENVDLSKIAHANANRLAKADPSRQVHFSIDETPPIQGDKHLLEIAIQNLMENAWKFTGKSSQAEIKFGAEVQDGRDVYYIRDNGVGFDMSYASRLFEPFQRLHSEKDFPGTGIGLAIVQRVIARHQGRIWAKGEPGKGATFYFTFKNGQDPQRAIN